MLSALLGPEMMLSLHSPQPGDLGAYRRKLFCQVAPLPDMVAQRKAEPVEVSRFRAQRFERSSGGAGRTIFPDVAVAGRDGRAFHLLEIFLYLASFQQRQAAPSIPIELAGHGERAVFVDITGNGL
jgi:hypothetical protein